MNVSTAVFYLIALITVGSAAMVAFSRNIIYSAFSLLGTFMGVAGIYIFLGADFVAAVQVLIYVGGILVLILFAVMLTHRITDVEVTNRAAGRIPALIIVGVLVYLLIETVMVTPWVKAKEVVYAADDGDHRRSVSIYLSAALRARVVGLACGHDRRGRAVAQGDQRVAMSPNELSSYLIIGAILFALGLFTVLTRRNAISVLMGVELILNSANINYVAFSHFGSGNADGQIYAIFVIMLAAAEAAVGLAIVLAIFQLFHTIDVEAAETLKE